MDWVSSTEGFRMKFTGHSDWSCWKEEAKVSLRRSALLFSEKREKRETYRQQPEEQLVLFDRKMKGKN